MSGWHALAASVTGAFSLLFFVLGGWLLRGLRRLQAAASVDQAELPTATVLVAARNESENIPQLSACLRALDYPPDKLRILVVDDRSTDGTSELVRRHGEGKIDVLRIEDCPPGIAPKKNALLAGIAASDSEILAVVDADNRPSPSWLQHHAARLAAGAGVSVGLVFHTPDPTVSEAFLGIWAAEIFLFGAISAAAIGNGFPLSANGGNLAYRRKAFEEAGAYAQNLGVVSGDDDFLVQAVDARTGWKVDFAIEPQTFVPTLGPRSWRQAWEQRKRWGSKCVRYEKPQVAFLSMIFIGYVWALLLFPASLFFPSLRPWGALLWGTLACIGFLVYDSGIRVLGPVVRRRWFPLTMVVQIPIAVAASIAGTFGRFRWKDGEVRGGALT